MLVSVGALGIVLPGLMGTPAIIAGGLVLWPATFSGLEEWLRRRNPGLYHRGMQQLGRFLDDLERRYPEVTKKSVVMRRIRPVGTDRCRHLTRTSRDRRLH